MNLYVQRETEAKFEAELRIMTQTTHGDNIHAISQVTETKETIFGPVTRPATWIIITF